MSDFPPTIVIIHPKERRKKCTVQQLRGRADFEFHKYPMSRPSNIENYVRLGFGGETISQSDAESGLLVLDGTWRFTATMEQEFSDVPIRSLPTWKTAYPRVSKLFDDPRDGLATIEAIYIAYRLLGRDTAGLLDHYHWAGEFLSLNVQG